MRHFFPLLAIAVLGHSTALAQQLPQYSLWQQNLYAYNPAVAGTEGTLVATGVYRRQWVDLDGAPVTQELNAHLPLNFLRSGVGVKFSNDAIGAHRTMDAMLSYSYHLELGRNTLVSLGAGAGYQQYTLDGDRLRTPRGDYSQGNLNHNDALLPLGRVSAGAPIFEMGIFLRSKQLALGVAAQPVFAPVIKVSSNGSFQLQPEQHYLASGTYTLEFGERFSVQPGVLVKTDLAATQIDLSVLSRWQDKILAGVGVRGIGSQSRDAAILMVGIRLSEKTILLYGYDLPLSGLQSTNRGSHEFLLRYSLNRPIGAGKLPPIIYNPRFF